MDTYLLSLMIDAACTSAIDRSKQFLKALPWTSIDSSRICPIRLAVGALDSQHARKLAASSMHQTMSTGGQGAEIYQTLI